MKTILLIHYKIMAVEFGGRGVVMTKGKKGERIFQKDFLEHLGIRFKDTSNIRSYQPRGIDFLTESDGSYEVKANLYGNNESLFIEENTNINEEFGPKKPGWWYTTEATYLVFVNNETHFMIILKLTDEAKSRYEAIKEQYELRWNEPSFRTDIPGAQWQSAYRIIPLSEFEGLYRPYQKVVGSQPKPIQSTEISSKEIDAVIQAKKEKKRYNPEPMTKEELDEIVEMCKEKFDVDLTK